MTKLKIREKQTKHDKKKERNIEWYVEKNMGV